MIKDIKFISPADLKPNPNNRNHHPEEQIERLIKLIQYQGFRAPVIVSNRSGFVVAGHGRLLAAQKMNLEKIPVSYQDFDDEDQEKAHGISDNAIGAWAELDMSNIMQDMQGMNTEFDFELFGIKNFNILNEPVVENTSEELNEQDFQDFQHECPKCGFEWSDSGSA